MAFNTTNGALPQGLGSGTDASSAMEQCEQEEIAKAIALSLETDQSDGASRVETSDPLYDKIATGRKHKIDFKRKLILDIMKSPKPRTSCEMS